MVSLYKIIRFSDEIGLTWEAKSKQNPMENSGWTVEPCKPSLKSILLETRGDEAPREWGLRQLTHEKFEQSAHV
jgi:hypothetical protein